MDFIESKTAKRLFKTGNGVEVRPSLLIKNQDSGTVSDQTYYYAWYFQAKEDGLWKIRTNSYLYGESKIMMVCTNRLEAEKTAATINAFIHLLIENVNQ